MPRLAEHGRDLPLVRLRRSDGTTVIGRRYTIGGGLVEWICVARAASPFNVGGPSGNVLLQRESDGYLMVRPFRGLRRVVAASSRKPVKSA
jgi:hypothetical protein